jgi:hypothetical protein
MIKKSEDMRGQIQMTCPENLVTKTYQPQVSPVGADGEVE